MKIGKFLKESILWENPNAEVFVETGDYGPCVAYDPAGGIFTSDDEDAWVDEGAILIDRDKNKPTTGWTRAPPACWWWPSTPTVRSF